MSTFQQITLKNFPVLYKNAKINEKLLHYSRYLSSNIPTKERETHSNKSTNVKFKTFRDKVNKRKTEAKKSILVQVPSAKSFKELYSYCRSFGDIKQMFHYSADIEPKHFILVEFQKLDGVTAALSSGTFIKSSIPIPSPSQFLYFRPSTKKLTEKQNKKIELAITDGLNRTTNESIRKELQNCESISDQINTLYEMSKLTDLETRLRFLTASQLEVSLSGMFSNVEVLPFGSSVNGFGRMGCDLDVVLTLNNIKEAPESRLVFHGKGSSEVDRSTMSRNLEAISYIMHFLPGCKNVRRILQARVPIFKYYQQFTDVECDLTMSNMSGVHMSDFLYMMGEFDPRVRPLVFAIRRWAEDVGITNDSPGGWITNFSLTLLVLAFLQNPLHSPPMLPTLNTLVKSAGPTDAFITDEGVNCTFLRDLSKLPHTTSNTEDLESLLCEFFEYYSQFDFSTKSVCLNQAVTLSKPDNSALYIVNPLERVLNVSKNVSQHELCRFREEVQNAVWHLQSTSDSKSKNWGLLSILRPEKSLRIEKAKYKYNSHSRVVIKELFDDSDVNEIQEKNDIVDKSMKHPIR